MTAGNNHTVNRYPWGPPDICPAALILPVLDERLWSLWFRIVVYFLTLLYFFVGVTIITDIFMSSIDRITSHTKKVYLAKTRLKKDGDSDSLQSVLREDEPEVIEVRVWNDTVANLILMAFGTASPEILLSVIETVGHHFEAGPLGPSTIVGSAAYNLLIITSICMLALPLNDTRRISRLQVFVVTALFSFLAYIWLLIILRHISPDEVELWEASVTFILFPILIVFAYAADKNYFGIIKSYDMDKQTQLELGPYVDSEKNRLEKELYKNGEIHRDNLISFIKEVKKFPGISDQEIALLAAAKLTDSSSHTGMWYRISGVRKFSGSRKVKPQLDTKLHQVYNIIKSHPEGLDLGDVPKAPDTLSSSVVEFHSPTIGVRENVGTFTVTVYRRGNLNHEARVRVDSIDGSAKQGEDYLRVKEVLIFAPDETEKKVEVRILDDNKWEPDEEFFLRLTVLGKHTDKNRVTLGKFSIMEVKIIDDDQAGILMFERRGLVVKESSGTVSVPIIRTKGAAGDVSVKWKTIDKSAISGRDYYGGEGTIYFKHLETKQTIDIDIIDDMTPEKDEYFEIMLYEPTGGARVGGINRTVITISNDDDYNTIVHRLMLLTNTNLDAMRVYSETWAEQIKIAMTVNGGDTANATTFDYTMHFISFFWKVLFAFLPPPAILGGWLCFFCSLIMIGILTTIIGDLATRFGCFIGLHDTITAITIVSLGTSLPDTLGARMVTRCEKHADGALIHISGSIAVNVLLGVGAPWLVAAAYHFNKGSKFTIHSEGLEFSVLMFSIAAVLAVFLILIRRRLPQCGKAEIGGPQKSRYVTVFVLVSLWILYLVFTYLEIYQIINPQFF